MKTLLPYMRKYRKFAILCPLFMVLELSSDILIPYLMSLIVDVGIMTRDVSYITRTGGIMIAIALVGMIIGIMSAHYGAIAGYGFAAEIRKASFEKIQTFSFANLDQFSVSSLITRLTTDANTVGMTTMMSLRMAIRAPFMMVFALIMAFNINRELARVFLVSLPLLTIILVIILGKARPLFELLQKKVDAVNSITQENLTGIRVVKSFNREDFEEAKFKKGNDELRDTALRAVTIIVAFMPVITVTIFSTIIAVLWIGGLQITAGSMGKGELISFIAYITQVLMAIMMLSIFFMQFMRGQASAKRIEEVLSVESEITSPASPVHQLEDGSIEFENVYFCYPGSREKTLHDINLKIKSGEVIGIIGSTGSSKSTLVQLIPRLYDVSSGTLKVGRCDVKSYDVESLRDQVAYVLQKNVLFSGTIRDNMKWGKEDATDEEIIQALKEAQAWEFVSKDDLALDKRVEQGGSNFSGGQKQRLTIARALMKRPKIIILDDSTSAVDVGTDLQIQRTFHEVLEGVTTILIAQRISSIQSADRIIVMNEGKIESIGTHEELLNSSCIYKEIYESQQKGVIGE
ncbi:ABC transporter ATP-binding protein [Gallicola sp. Sow4_E12]|uniref:ABC transporter ATP-binding protein n=1 Tax=Gallicola sp. Sow4_E12 TaxID=3438785 RepID=UPI003F9176EF